MTTKQNIENNYSEAAREYNSTYYYMSKMGIKFNQNELCILAAKRWEVDDIYLWEYICGCETMDSIVELHLKRYNRVCA